MNVELNFKSPYITNGNIKQNLPKLEVLATDGTNWAIGILVKDLSWIALRKLNSNDILISKVARYAELPIIKDLT